MEQRRLPGTALVFLLVRVLESDLACTTTKRGVHERAEGGFEPLGR
jgi:hypothetical protein